MFCVEQRRRCCSFSAKSTIYFCARKRNSYYGINLSTPSVLRFFWLIHHKRFHYNHAFTEKTQHLRRWISLRMFTRGRLVPRQPRAIKNTTRTELHHEGIYITKFIHLNNSATPTALRDETIVWVIWLIRKREMIWCISSCKIRQNIGPFDAF